MSKVALLFGLNYHGNPHARLRGCWNDVNNMKMYLKTKGYLCYVHTDAVPNSKTTKEGIVDEICKIAKQTHETSVEHVVIHYSGHGSYMRDQSNDEKDGKDECLVPIDYSTAGLLRDDKINDLLKLFHSNTKITCIFDCCHSGTIADLQYRFINKRKLIESKKHLNSKIVSLSGCRDDQTSADAFNVLGQRTYSGAMTSCLLTCLKTYPNASILELLSLLQDELKTKRFRQVPQLCSSFDLTNQKTLLIT